MSLLKLPLSDDRLLFAVLLTCRIFCVCLTAIQTSKEHEVDEGFADVIEKGWLIKEGANDDSRRKRQVVNFRHIKLVITPQKQNILSHNRVYVLSCKHASRPMRARVLSYRGNTIVGKPVVFIVAHKGKNRK